MSNEKVIVEIGADDKATPVIDNVAGKTESMGARMKSSLEGASDSSKKFALALAGVGSAALAMSVVSFNAYKEAEAAQKQLEHAVIGVTKGTQAQLKATMDLADALERKGVLDGDNIKTGLAQLSTFGLQNETVQALGGSLADLAVNQFGVNASGEQLTQTANMIAKALNGQFGVLEKSGIRFTELQKKIIMTGTEMQKAKAINEGFAQNLKYTNEVAMQTGEGLQAHLMVQLGNLQEAFGKMVSDAIVPLMAAFSAWLDSLGGPEAAIALLVEKFKEIQPYFPLIAGVIVGMLVPAFYAWATATWAAVAPLIPFAAAGAAVAAVAYLIYEAYQTNFLGFKDIVTTVVAAIIPVLQGLMDFWTLFTLEFTAAVEYMRFAWETNMFGIQTIAEFAWTAISLFFKSVWDIIRGIFKVFLGLITLDWSTAWDGIKLIAKGVLEFITLGFRIFWEELKVLWSFGGEAIANGWNNMMGGIASLATNIWEKIKQVFKDGINVIISYVNSFIKTYNSAISKVPGGKNLKLPEFTPLAEGGIVTRPTFALIGEAGPEAVIPLNRSSGARGSVGGGVTLVIQDNNFYGDDQQFMQKLGDQIMKMLEPHLSY